MRHLRLLSSLLLPFVARAEISPREARDAFPETRVSAPREMSEEKSHAPTFAPADTPATASRRVERRSGEFLLYPPDAFFGVDLGYAMNKGAVSANGRRAELAGAFNHDVGGIALHTGADFGFGRVGVSTGYYADHVPWGLALAGEVAAVALLGANSCGCSLPDPYYQLRTELSVIPLTVFYEQKIPLPKGFGELRFGPVVGGTIHIASADYAGHEATDADIAFTYGGRVAYDAYIDRRTRLRLAYEYRRMGPTDFDLGFSMRMHERDTHLFSIGITSTF